MTIKEIKSVVEDGVTYKLIALYDIPSDIQILRDTTVILKSVTKIPKKKVQKARTLYSIILLASLSFTAVSVYGLLEAIRLFDVYTLKSPTGFLIPIVLLGISSFGTLLGGTAMFAVIGKVFISFFGSLEKQVVKSELNEIPENLERCTIKRSARLQMLNRSSMVDISKIYTEREHDNFIQDIQTLVNSMSEEEAAKFIIDGYRYGELQKEIETSKKIIQSHSKAEAFLLEEAKKVQKNLLSEMDLLRKSREEYTKKLRNQLEHHGEFKKIAGKMAVALPKEKQDEELLEFVSADRNKRNVYL